MSDKKHYFRIRYNESEDSFEIQTRTEGERYGSDFLLRCKCVSRDGSANTNYISYGILNRINELVELGYILEVRK